MVLDLLGSSKKPATVSDLITRKKYAEALALIQEQLRKAPADTSLRMQAADVLVLQGKIDAATRTLEAVADDFAKEGYAAKAIAVLKKWQKLDPRRTDLEARIVDLFKSTAPTRVSTPAPVIEFGMLAPEDGEAIDISFGAEAEPEPPAATPEPVAPLSPAPFLSEEPGNFVVDIEPETPAPKRSPLFSDFTDDEMVDVVRGLELLTYEPGDIIVTEGEKGDSLYVVSSGSVKAFIRNRDGGSTQIRELNEGDFFGEISILSGKPRTATITAASQCELLRLDRPTLDSITKTRPRVRQVLERFYEQRSSNAAEAEIRGLDAGTSETVKLAGLDGERQTTAPGAQKIAVAEENATDDLESRVQHLRNCAIESSRKQNWADAVQAWQQYIALKPQDLDAPNVLGVLFGKLGRWKEAAQSFERLVELKSTDATIFFNLGLCYRQLNLLPQSASAYRRAVALKPDYEKAKQNLTSVLNLIKKEAMA